VGNPEAEVRGSIADFFLASLISLLTNPQHPESKIRIARFFLKKKDNYLSPPSPKQYLENGYNIFAQAV
jgi:hypothetical protein